MVNQSLIEGKSTKFYKPELDGLRFFAFFLVFIHHHKLLTIIPKVGVLHSIGWIGVDLFFVLSAYLFTKLLVLEFNKTQKISFRKFFLRRIFRIWPIYYTFIFFCILFKIGIQNQNIINKFGLIRIAGLFTFSDNLFTAYFDQYNEFIPFVSHLWTISFEEQFYVIIPFLILYLIKLNFKKRNIFFIILFVVLTLFRLFLIRLGVNYYVFWTIPLVHFESILFGIILGFNENFLPKIKPIIWLLISTICIFIILYLPIVVVNFQLSALYLLVGVSMTLIVKATLISKPIKRILSVPFLVFFGKRSYGLYLFHFLGIYIGTKLYEDNLYVSFIVSLTATMLISIFSYRFIEGPFLKLKKKYEVIKSRPI